MPKNNNYPSPVKESGNSVFITFDADPYTQLQGILSELETYKNNMLNLVCDQLCQIELLKRKLSDLEDEDEDDEDDEAPNKTQSQAILENLIEKNIVFKVDENVFSELPVSKKEKGDTEKAIDDFNKLEAKQRFAVGMAYLKYVKTSEVLKKLQSTLYNKPSSKLSLDDKIKIFKKEVRALIPTLERHRTHWCQKLIIKLGNWVKFFLRSTNGEKLSVELNRKLDNAEQPTTKKSLR